MPRKIDPIERITREEEAAKYRREKFAVGVIQRLRPMRITRGLSVPQCARIVGVAEQTWYKWEALGRKGRPDRSGVQILTHLPNLARALGCSVVDLVDGLD